MLKIRRLLGRLIFNMGIAIPGKTVFLIETAPRVLCLARPLVEVLAVVVLAGGELTKVTLDWLGCSGGWPVLLELVFFKMEANRNCGRLVVELPGLLPSDWLLDSSPWGPILRKGLLPSILLSEVWRPLLMLLVPRSEDGSCQDSSTDDAPEVLEERWRGWLELLLQDSRDGEWPESREIFETGRSSSKEDSGEGREESLKCEGSTQESARARLGIVISATETQSHITHVTTHLHTHIHTHKAHPLFYHTWVLSHLQQKHSHTSHMLPHIYTHIHTHKAHPLFYHAWVLSHLQQKHSHTSHMLPHIYTHTYKAHPLFYHAWVLSHLQQKHSHTSHMLPHIYTHTKPILSSITLGYCHICNRNTGTHHTCYHNPQIRLFQTLTLKLQGQGHEWGQRSRSHSSPSNQPMHLLFVSYQSDQPFLRYVQYSVWPWKDTSEIFKENLAKKSFHQNSSKI